MIKYILALLLFTNTVYASTCHVIRDALNKEQQSVIIALISGSFLEGYMRGYRMSTATDEEKKQMETYVDVVANYVIEVTNSTEETQKEAIELACKNRMYSSFDEAWVDYLSNTMIPYAYIQTNRKDS